MPSEWKSTQLALLTMALVTLHGCGGSNLLCDCVPTRPAEVDFRHLEKHIPLPAVTPVETTVTAILAWPPLPNIVDGSPRTGRELQLFHVAQAFVQFVRLVPGDCDLHIEISATPDKNAPRVIVETPSDPEYCSARSQLASQLRSHGASITDTGQELFPAVGAQVLGMGFEDFEHQRGTPLVATTWELHPAIVTLQ